MQSAKFLKLLFSTALIDRWNDQVRFVDLNELDKQAYKMVIAYLLAIMEENENNKKIDYLKLIEYGISEFIYRAVLTDLKPQVFHYLLKHKKEALTNYVKKEIYPLIDDKLKKVFQNYLDSDESEIERKILNASHFLASKWEFDIIYDYPKGFQKDEIKKNLEFRLEDFFDLVGVRRLSLGSKTKQFLDICATLRFQKRWSKTPRIPQTSVLGHMLFVAVLSYLFSIEYNACKQTTINNFFTALFHDIAESLTRDIISPIKYGVEGLDEILKEYENNLIEEKLLPLLPSYARDRMRYYIVDEFANKINNPFQKLPLEEMPKNEDKFDSIDGSLIKVADNLAAFIEASESINNGIAPESLKDAKESLLKKYKDYKIYGIDVYAILIELEGR